MSKAVVGIEYCQKCRFVLRASWIAQELLFTFGDVLQAVSLVPSGGGVFRVTVDDEVVWDRDIEGAFPDSKELKQRIRDVVAPEFDLGHSDVKK
jgi:selenoprotein W-related protein